VDTRKVESPIRQLCKMANDVCPPGLDVVHALTDAINSFESAMIKVRNLVETPEKVNQFINLERAKIAVILNDEIIAAQESRAQR
jgi:hypothetical protein